MTKGPAPKIPDGDFVRLFEEIGPHKLAAKLGQSKSRTLHRRASLETKIGRQIKAPEYRSNTRRAHDNPGRINITVKNGVVLIGSDAHIWPGPKSTAMRAFIKFIRDMKPAAVILNGDVIDLPQVSRHPPIGWQHMPTVQEEIEAAQEVLAEIEAATFKARKIWTLGNHDQRYETRLATIAPEFVRLHGFSLKDWFPAWEPCWSVWINEVVVKHRYKGGIHATHNNAVQSGKSMVTGHLHSAKVTPWTDYGGTRYGVDTGCLADPDHRAFLDYTEDNPKNWRSAFGVLTFRDGKLLQPEIALVHDASHVDFRGELVKI